MTDKEILMLALADKCDEVQEALEYLEKKKKYEELIKKISKELDNVVEID